MTKGSGSNATHRDRGSPWAVRLPLVLLPIFVVLPCQLDARQTNSVDGTIFGQVVDETTGAPVPGVLVEFLDVRDRPRRRTTTDAEGNFVLGRLPAGEFSLRASSVGYQRTQTPSWWIDSGEVLSVTIRIHSDVILLAPLEVTARSLTRSAVLSGFYDRMDRRVIGTFITREEIEERNPTLVTDLFYTLPGVQLTAVQGGAHTRMVSMGRSMFAAGGGDCPVQVYVDGILATRGEPASPDELASPQDLEGIEVYRGLAGVPAEFLTPEARCGVIALWTRRRR